MSFLIPIHANVEYRVYVRVVLLDVSGMEHAWQTIRAYINSSWYWKTPPMNESLF